MEKSEIKKEEILAQTTALISECGGDTQKVTIRKIAGRCGVSVGLINHYFGSKDRLIEACVQRIIGGVIRSFRPDAANTAPGGKRLARVAKQVLDFLTECPQISRISILGDLSAPQANDNTMGTVFGFAGCLSGQEPGADDLLTAMLLTAVLQQSFLRKSILKARFGIDLDVKSERDAYIDRVLQKLLKGGSI